MPRSETVLSVFVASPGDVAEEREVLEDVIRELNGTWRKSLGYSLELVAWETHVHPAFGTDAQDVVNAQVGSEYDIFIGIMWTSYGTATGRADSGTVEEFERAYGRFLEDDACVVLMFYFKDEVVAPSSIDPDQLRKVQQFRRKIKDLGGLHGDFRKPEEFASLVRLHLSRVVQEWQNRESAGGGQTTLEESPTATAAVAATEDGDGDLGYLDFIDTFTESFGRLGESIRRMSEAQAVLTERIEQRTTEWTEVGTLAPDLRLKPARRIARRTADDMDDYVSRMKAEIPIYQEALHVGLDAFGRASALESEFGADDPKRLAETRSQVAELRTSMAGAIESLRDFRKSAAGLPRIAKELNHAKRRTTEILDEVLRGFETGHDLAMEIERDLERRMGE